MTPRTSRALPVLAVAAAVLGTAALASAEHLTGTRGGDRLNGSGRADVLSGRGGPDQINARGGRDRVSGGGGPDVLRGQKGRDRLSGGKGNDTVLGGAGNDVMSGGRGHDEFNSVGGVRTGAAGNDRINARDGSEDSIDCGPGRDVAIVDASEDGVFDCEVVREP